MNKAMSYEILDSEHGDVLAAYDSLDEAKRALAAYLAEHPEREADLAIATVDDATGIATEVVSADELHALR